MRTIRKFIKTIAAFLFVNTLCYVFFPSVALALTSGPTAPEYSSFEPFDTTDMVNLVSGDLAYNIPLLEVPGPAGGYPLSLSYHAGIAPELEASWVGLGWTLNPGAINRTVAGYPDDYNDVTQIDRMFWEEHRVDQFTLGLSYGIPNSPATVSGGLTFANDSHLGTGVGGYIGASLSGPIGKLSGGAGVTLGVAPFGNGYVSTGVSVGVGASTKNGYQATGSLGLSHTTGQSIQGGLSGGISKRSETKSEKPFTNSILGASISSSSKGTKFSSSVLGGSKGINNSKSGNVSTKSGGFSLDIPTVVVPGLNVRLGYSYMRDWIDETATSSTFGSLYYPTTDGSGVNYDELSFDFYDNQTLETKLDEAHLDKYSETEFLRDYRDISGTFIENDMYSVSAQGVHGNIEPYHFQTYVSRQNLKHHDDNSKYDVKNYYMGKNPTRPEFRFMGDFSNRLENPSLNFSFDPSNDDRPVTEITSIDYETGTSGTDGFENGKLIGSRNIEWFTVQEIESGSARSSHGFVGGKMTTLLTTPESKSKIGGFMITNESGVTYHFGQPAYSYNEYSVSVNTESGSRENFNQLTKTEPYAYTWMLTAVTGPDYVDRTNNGLTNDDWGYWVGFDYGLWHKEYKWRNPGTGEHMDIDNVFSQFSKGAKEVYYLDAIKTKSHTAYFIKDLRFDGKSTTSYIDSGVETGSQQVIGWDEGGYIPELEDRYNTYAMEFPIPSLKLSSILLTKNGSVAPFEKDDGEKTLPTEYEYVENLTDTRKFIFPDEDNVFTVKDIEVYDKAEVIREIEFDHDYSLVEGTPNSFTNEFYQNQYPSTDETDYSSLGKLTLNAIHFNGKEGTSGILPPLQFYYDIENPAQDPDAVYTAYSDGWGSVSDPDNILEEGDILRFDYGGDTPIDLLIKRAGGSSTATAVQICPSSERLPSNTYSGSWRVTKNPSYYKDAVDRWGFYKSDYSDELAEENQNIAKYTTSLSAKGVDVWSLRRIKSSLGSEVEINYESDTYSNIELEEKHNLITNNESGNPMSPNKFYGIENASEFFKVGDEFDIVIGCIERSVDCGLTARYEIFESSIRVSSIDEYGNIYWEGDLYRDFGEVPSEGNCEMERVDANASFLRLPQSPEYFGGGLRINSIKLKDEYKQQSRTTHYNYQKVGSQLSSGSTSFSPMTFDVIPMGSYDGLLEKFKDEIKTKLQKELYGSFNDLLNYSREIPGPGVMYEDVEVTETITHSDGTTTTLPNKSRYEFQVFRKNMIQVESPQIGGNNSSGQTSDGITYYGVKTAKNQIHNLTQNVGALKSIKLISFDPEKPGEEEFILTETINHYLYDKISDEISSDDFLDEDDFLPEYYNALGTYSKQGVITQSTINARWVQKDVSEYKHELYGAIVNQTEYPNILLGQTNTNYKTGLSNRSWNLGFDFYSGATTVTSSEDIYGHKYISKVVPAYRMKNDSGLEQYPLMGPKDDDPSNLNMLTQVGATYTFKMASEYDPDIHTDYDSYKESLVSGNIQTWTDGVSVMDGNSHLLEPEIFRKHGNYKYVGNGTTNADGTYDDILADQTTLTNNKPGSALWKFNSEITLYDVNSHPIELIDINGNYASTKFDITNSVVLSTTTNASYGEQFFTSAEDYVIGSYEFGGGVELGDYSTVHEGEGHTGSHYVGTASGETSFKISTNEVELGKTYLVQVWTDKADAKLYYRTSGGSWTECENRNLSNPIGEWYLLSGTVTSTIDKYDAVNSLFVESRAGAAASTKFDDFRFFPLAAGMVSYVYNEYGELSAILDRNNLATFYKYDNMGRLKSVWTESFQYGVKKISENEINYAN